MKSNSESFLQHDKLSGESFSWSLIIMVIVYSFSVLYNMSRRKSLQTFYNRIVSENRAMVVKMTLLLRDDDTDDIEIPLFIFFAPCCTDEGRRFFTPANIIRLTKFILHQTSQIPT